MIFRELYQLSLTYTSVALPLKALLSENWENRGHHHSSSLKFLLPTRIFANSSEIDAVSSYFCTSLLPVPCFTPFLFILRAEVLPGDALATIRPTI
jgi:hypothetical protein